MTKSTPPETTHHTPKRRAVLTGSKVTMTTTTRIVNRRRSPDLRAMLTGTLTDLERLHAKLAYSDVGYYHELV
jgi:hypothetical protein